MVTRQGDRNIFKSSPAHAVGWSLIPERLVNSLDPEVREFFSSVTEAQAGFAAAGYTDEARQDKELIEKFGKYRGNGGLTFPHPPTRPTRSSPLTSVPAAYFL